MYLGLSLVVVWAGWVQFIFGQFLDPAYISQDLQATSSVVGTNYRVLIYCTCLCFSFFCLLVSSVSNFCPDTRVQWWTVFQAHLFSAVGREGRCKQITLASVCTVSATLGLPLLTGVCTFLVYTAQALGCSAGNCPVLALGCMHLPRLSCSGSGTRVVLRGADSVGPAFCALPRSEQLR